MTEVSADPDALTALGLLLGRLADSATESVQALAQGGNHGSSQGTAVADAVAHFQGIIGPQTNDAIATHRRHAQATLRIATAVRDTETAMVAAIHARAHAVDKDLRSADTLAKDV